MPNRSTRRRRARGRPAHRRRNRAASIAAAPRLTANTRVDPAPLAAWPANAAAACLALSLGLALAGLSRSLHSLLDTPDLPPSPIPAGPVVGLLGILFVVCGSRLPRRLAGWLLNQVLRPEPTGARPTSDSASWTDRQLGWITFAMLSLTVGVILALTPAWQQTCGWAYYRLHQSFVWSDPFLAVLVTMTVGAALTPACLITGMALACLGRLFDSRQPTWRLKSAASLLIGLVAGVAAADSVLDQLPAAMLPALAALPALAMALVCAYRLESIGNRDVPTIQRGTRNDAKSPAVAPDSEDRLVGLHRPIPYPRMGRARPAATGRSADSRRRLTA